MRQTQVNGLLRVGSSVAFGRRVVVPLVLEFMARHPQVKVDLSFDDRYTDLVAQGIDVAIRLGKLADSGLGARSLGQNPWALVASPTYLRRHGTPRKPTERNAITHERIAADLEAFYKSGGQIEVLGVTRSLTKIDGGDASPPAPAKARR